MAGIYIHIPFCKSRCIYCAFYSTTGMEQRQRYVDAVCKEWSMRQHEAGEPIDTIYIGGGTPSQLSDSQLRQLFDRLPHANSETTIEVNPDDVTQEFATLLSTLPVNRVSMGAQTFDDQRLRFLHRRHTSAQVAEAVRLLRDAGIHNISIDLMYGFPGETLSDWEHDMNAALALGVEHISAYCLMIEEGTALFNQMRNEELEMRNGEMRKLAMPSEELERRMYYLLKDQLEAAGYEHYEISNFARPDFRSRHNSSYWHDIPYIGLGAAAHSYDRHCRSWNVSDIKTYCERIEQGELPSEQEVLDDDTHYNDLITTALRTSDGLDLATLSDRHRHFCLREAQPYLSDGLLRQQDSHIMLTREGLFVSDMVMSALMMV